MADSCHGYKGALRMISFKFMVAMGKKHIGLLALYMISSTDMVSRERYG
jgi:hypothetical protein